MLYGIGVHSMVRGSRSILLPTNRWRGHVDGPCSSFGRWGCCYLRSTGAIRAACDWGSEMRAMASASQAGALDVVELGMRADGVVIAASALAAPPLSAEGRRRGLARRERSAALCREEPPSSRTREAGRCFGARSSRWPMPPGCFDSRARCRKPAARSSAPGTRLALPISNRALRGCTLACADIDARRCVSPPRGYSAIFFFGGICPCGCWSCTSASSKNLRRAWAQHSADVTSPGCRAAS